MKGFECCESGQFYVAADYILKSCHVANQFDFSYIFNQNHVFSINNDTGTCSSLFQHQND